MEEIVLSGIATGLLLIVEMVDLVASYRTNRARTAAVKPGDADPVVREWPASIVVERVRWHFRALIWHTGQILSLTMAPGSHPGPVRVPDRQMNSFIQMRR